MSAPATSSRLTLPVFFLSAAALAQELLLVRLLAIGLWHHVTYMVVTVALLAFGLAGTVLAVAPRLAGRTPAGSRRAFSWCCLLFAGSTLVSGLRISGTGIDTINLVRDPSLYWSLFSRYMVTGLPLFFGGLGVVMSLKGEGRGIARVYFSNLLGSALGCLLFVILLQPLSGPGLLALTAALSAFAALIALWRNGSKPLAGLALLALCLCALLTVWPDILPPILPVPSKMMAKKLAEGGRVETTLWNPICRIDVVTEPEKDSPKNIYQDGDATTWIFKGGDPQATESAEISIPYMIRPDVHSLLIIGVGGGREIAVALAHKVEHVVAVDINSATISLLKQRYFGYSGQLAQDPRVTLLNDEGRAYLSRTEQHFDFIQMTGVDTYAALNSGAYVLSESYLYTRQAMRAYLDHLNPGGFISVLRFYFNPPRESLRLFVMALLELKARGVEDPGRNAVVVAAGAWAALIMGNSPVPPERMDKLRRTVAALQKKHAAGGQGIAVKIVHDPLRPLDTPFSHFARALKEGREQAFQESYRYNITPPDDDSPFFYNYHRWGNFFKKTLGLASGTSAGEGPTSPEAKGSDAWRANTGDLPFGIKVLAMLLLFSTGAGLLFILIPLLVFHWRALKLPGKLRPVVYFSCLGLGFMFVEIGLAQRFTLFLGHPSYSLAIVLGGMLAFSGLGSLCSALFSPRRTLPLVLPLIALLLVALLVFLPAMTETWLHEELFRRALLALGVLAPLSFCMGMPMPGGLRILHESSSDLVPWAWGINGVASVMGSILAIILAMLLSFTWVLILAATLYLGALLARVQPAV